MRIDNWAYIDPTIKAEIRDTIENEIKSGVLTDYVAKDTDSFIRFDSLKDKSNYVGKLCNSGGEFIRKFTIDSEFNFEWSIDVHTKLSLTNVN
jgi:hypothetical protein